MKTTLILLLTFFTTLGFSQKVKVKKDEVLFDGVAVAKVEEPAQLDYIFTSLDGSNSIKVNYKYLKITEELTNKWLIVSDANGERKTEIEMEFLSFTMNLKKATAELLAKKYNIITTNGIENLDDFFSTERPSLTDKNNALISQKNVKEQEAWNQNFNVDYIGKKIFEGPIPYSTSPVDNYKRDKNYENLIGYYNITPKSSSSTTSDIYTIYDYDEPNGQEIATAYVDVTDETSVRLVREKTSFNYKTKVSPLKNSSQTREKEFVEELVSHLYINNIILNEKTKAIAAEKKLAWADYEERIATSSNLYDVEGYVVDKDGTKYEGTITMIWEYIPTPDNPTGTMNVNIGNSWVGKEVKIDYINEKEKSRDEKFKSIDNISFFVKNGDDPERHYKGISLLSESSKSGDQLIITSQFYEIIEENDKIAIFRHPQNKETGILLKGRSYGFILYNNEGNFKRFSNLEQYLSCKLPEEVKFLDYSNISNVKKVFDNYNNSCN